MPDTADRNQAMANWGSYAKNRKTGQPTIELSIQSFVLFQIRRILAVDLNQAWLPFGGLAHQLPHLSIALNLSVVESVGVDPQYRQALMTKLSEKARQWANGAEAFTLPMSTEQLELREQAMREVASSHKAKETASPPVKTPKGTPPPRQSSGRKRTV